MTIGKIFGIGTTGLKFDSQKNNNAINNSDVSFGAVYKYAIPESRRKRNDRRDEVLIKYGIPSPEKQDRNLPPNAVNEIAEAIGILLKYNIISLPAPKYGIPKPEQDNINNNYDDNDSGVYKYAIPRNRG